MFHLWQFKYRNTTSQSHLNATTALNTKVIYMARVCLERAQCSGNTIYLALIWQVLQTFKLFFFFFYIHHLLKFTRFCRFLLNQKGGGNLLTITAELIGVALLILAFVSALCCVISCKMYLDVMTICKRNDLPVQVPEMEGQWRRFRRGAADRRRDARRNRQTNNHLHAKDWESSAPPGS